MSCKARIGVWAAVLLLGCSNAGDDDSELDNPALAGTGGAPVMMGPIQGNPMTPVGGAAGGSAPGGGGSGSMVGTAGNAPVAGTGMGAAGMGAAGMGTAGMEMGGAAGDALAGMGGMAGGEAGTMAPVAVPSPCITAGSQVVFIGDSYSVYDFVHQRVSTFVQQRAVMDGALMAGQRYADYAAPGTTLAGPLASIPPQWEDNKSKVPIHLVIMDGGGNDVLINNQACLVDDSQQLDTCKAVVERSMMSAKTLWASMKMAGVKDVIWFWYPHIPGTAFGNGHDINDYTLQLLITAAAEASTADFHVYMVDTIPIFMGNESKFFYADGVHANDAGTAAIADAIWKLMKDKCIGQGPASGCCKQ